MTMSRMVATATLVLTLSGTLVGCGGTVSAPPIPEVPDQALTQADKVFASVQAAEEEYERLFSETKYPDDKTKQKASLWAIEKNTLFHINKLLYEDLKSKRTRLALVVFVGGSVMFVDSPKGIFTRYDFSDKTLKDGEDVYANLSKIESIVNEYRVYVLSALREVK